MSMFLHDLINDKIVSFTEFCLNESIAPRKIKFGVNESMDDEDFLQTVEMYYTFFEFDGMFYNLMLSKKDKEFGFCASSKKSFDLRDYDDVRTTTRKALYVFGHIMYVLFELIDATKLKEVKFRARDLKLGAVYSTIVKNKFVLDHIKKKGFEYSGLFDEFHIFKRK